MYSHENIEVSSFKSSTVLDSLISAWDTQRERDYSSYWIMYRNKYSQPTLICSTYETALFRKLLIVKTVSTTDLSMTIPMSNVVKPLD